MSRCVFQIIVAVILIVGVTGCCGACKRGEKAEGAETKEAPAQQVSLSQVPEPARAAIEKVTAGGKIKKIEKAEEGGKTIYDVEATLRDRDVEYDIAADGTILTSEQAVPYTSVPLVVRNAAEKYFGSATGLKGFVELEEGKTFYEISGKKGKTPMTIKLTDTGQIIEEEKE
ncbi:MAG: hypothetical protein M1376_08325 [Planctomycetes bacterium]|nr:hypothetical protein [Planctomycetota bacterium]